MVRVGRVRTFSVVRPDKAQALKPLEEAAEVFSAWQEWDSTSGDPVDQEAALNELVNECADVIQATCNLLASVGISDMTVPMFRCEQRNRMRGRM